MFRSSFKNKIGSSFRRHSMSDYGFKKSSESITSSSNVFRGLSNYNDIKKVTGAQVQPYAQVVGSKSNIAPNSYISGMNPVQSFSAGRPIMERGLGELPAVDKYGWLLIGTAGVAGVLFAIFRNKGR